MVDYGWLNSVDFQSLTVPALWQLKWDALKFWWIDVSAEFELWRRTLDPAIWLLSSLLAMVPGGFVIYKWWNYRNSRLPERLALMLAKDEVRLREHARAALLQAVENPSAARAVVSPPIFAVPALKTCIRNIGWAGWINPFPFETADKELGDAIAEIEERLKFCEKSRADCRRQEATAYLVKGAIAAARAKQKASSKELSDRLDRDALNYFLRALEIDQNDTEALEYLAHQHRILGQHDLALSSFQRLAELTKNSGGESNLTTAKAYRHIGEILEKQHESSGVLRRLEKAKDFLEKALLALPPSARGQLDHAAIYEVTGRVEEKRGTTNLPLQNYLAAFAMYNALVEKNPDALEAKLGADRMKKVTLAFRNPSQDGAPFTVAG